MALATAYASFRNFMYVKIAYGSCSEVKGLLKFTVTEASTSAGLTSLVLFGTERKIRLRMLLVQPKFRKLPLMK
jgi:hypothetical protein